MTNIRIRKLEIDSLKLDGAAPPSYGTINVEVGGKPIKLFLSQEEVDALVAAAEPIMRGVLREVSAVLSSSQKPRIVA